MSNRDHASGPIRLAACATHPIQYHAPVWRRLAGTSGVDFHAFFGTDMGVRGYRDAEFGTHVQWNRPLTDGYAHAFLSNDPGLERIDAWRPSARGLGARLREFRPDAVLVTAYAGRFHLGAIRQARRLGAKLVLRHEASDAALGRTGLRRSLRDAVLRRLYARVDVFAVIGGEARRHLRRLGVPEAKLVPAPYCVDTDFFAGEAARWGARREASRADLGVPPDGVALVFAGKLIAKKDPLAIPAAVRALPESLRQRLHFLVVGDGELRAAVAAAARDVFGSRARSCGFLDQTGIGRVYGAGDLLVLPSRRGAGETWGLVVNEALQFGLPAIVSDGVGCAEDLITPETGAVYRAGETAALAAAIAQWSARVSADRAACRRAATARAEKFSAAAATEGIAAAVRRCVTR